MTIFEYTKSKNVRTARIFGFPLYVLTKDVLTKNKSQTFCGGMFSTTFKDFAGNKEKLFKIFNLTFFKITDDGFNKTDYLFNIKIRKRQIKNIFFNKYKKFIPAKYDDIYILNANSGEIYLFLTYILKALLSKNNSKTPLLIATKKYHLEMLKVIAPEIDCILIEKIKPAVGEYCFSINKQRFFVIFPYTHYLTLEKNIKNSTGTEYHYFKYMLEKLNLEPDNIRETPIKIPESQEIKILQKASSTGLNIENFVFISPEAATCKLLPEYFWKDLIKQFRQKGLDVFVNLADNKVNLGDSDYKTCNLTYIEAFGLAAKSKKIISLRSGLTEFLMQTNVPMVVFYTEFQNRAPSQSMNINQIINNYGLSQIPHNKTNTIEEYAFLEAEYADMLKIAQNISVSAG